MNEASATPATPAPKKRAVAVKAPLSDLQKEFLKHAKNLESMKHIDAKTLGLNYLFPCLDLLARVVEEITQNATQQEEALDGLTEAVEDIANGEVDLFTDVRDLVVKFAGLLDETLVVAGFFAVGAQGLTDTGKLDALGEVGKALKLKILAIGPDAAEILGELQEAIESASGDVDGDGDVDEVDDTTQAQAAIASAVASPASSVVVVASPGVVPAVAAMPLTPDAVIEAPDAP